MVCYLLISLDTWRLKYFSMGWNIVWHLTETRRREYVTRLTQWDLSEKSSPPPHFICPHDSSLIYSCHTRENGDSSDGKMFIYLWQKWHWVTSCQECHKSVCYDTVFVVWRAIYQEWKVPTVSLPTPEPGDGCKVNQKWFYLRLFGQGMQGLFWQKLSTDFILWFKCLRSEWPWQAGRAGPSYSKMKVPTDFQVPMRAPEIGKIGQGREGAVGIWGRGLKTKTVELVSMVPWREFWFYDQPIIWHRQHEPGRSQFYTEKIFHWAAG